jgi:hypothetical protein
MSLKAGRHNVTLPLQWYKRWAILGNWAVIPLPSPPPPLLIFLYPTLTISPTHFFFPTLLLLIFLHPSPTNPLLQLKLSSPL